MKFAAGAHKVDGASQCLSTRKEVSMVTLQAARTRYCHTELFSGNTHKPILTLPWKKEGGLEKTQHTNGKQATRL